MVVVRSIYPVILYGVPMTEAGRKDSDLARQDFAYKLQEENKRIIDRIEVNRLY